MHFWRKIGQIVGWRPLAGWRPLWEILDPPLQTIFIFIRLLSKYYEGQHFKLMSLSTKRSCGNSIIMTKQSPDTKNYRLAVHVKRVEAANITCYVFLSSSSA